MSLMVSVDVKQHSSSSGSSRSGKNFPDTVTARRSLGHSWHNTTAYAGAKCVSNTALKQFRERVGPRRKKADGWARN